VKIFKAAQAREGAFLEAGWDDFDSSRSRLNLQARKLQVLFEESGDEKIKEQIDELKRDMERMDHDLYSPAARKEMMDKSFRASRRR